MKHILSILISVVCLALSSQAAQPQHPDPAELSFDDNLEQPAVPKKAAQAIVRHMEQIRASLAKHGLRADNERSGEIVMVTIPVELLFAPNGTVLLTDGEKYLRPFCSLLKYPTMYKLIVAVHSDDTGEPAYLENLTSLRATAIDEFLTRDSGTSGTSLVPYGLATDSPVADNNSIASRAANRRVEIYIVPNWQMIETARSGKLR